MGDKSNWKIKGKSTNGGSLAACVFVFVMFVVATMGAMMATSLISVIMSIHHGVDKSDFMSTNLMSMHNLMTVIACMLEGAVLVVFILLAKRDGMTAFGICSKSSVLLIYGALTVGFGVSYIVVEHVPTLLFWNLKLAGIASEVAVMLLALLGLQIAACGCYTNTVYDLVATGGILGCCLGCVRAYQVDTYFGTVLIDNSWILLGDVLIYSTFYSGTLSLASSLISRAHTSRSFAYICCGILLPVGLAGGFGCFTLYPVYVSTIITNTALRYCVGGLGAALACFLAVVAFMPFRSVKINRIAVSPEDSDSIKFAKSLMTVEAVSRKDSSQISV